MALSISHVQNQSFNASLFLSAKIVESLRLHVERWNGSFFSNARTWCNERIKHNSTAGQRKWHESTSMIENTSTGPVSSFFIQKKLKRKAFNIFEIQTWGEVGRWHLISSLICSDIRDNSPQRMRFLHFWFMSLPRNTPLSFDIPFVILCASYWACNYFYNTQLLSQMDKQ